MKRLAVLVLLLLFVALPLPALGLVSRNGGTVSVSEATDDDVFATGGTISVDAPVGSLVAAGGQITVNAPVKGDLIAAGGQVTINSDVGGKVVAAGGSVILNGKVGTNAVLAGGNVQLGPSSSVSRDAMVSGGSVTNAGKVTGKLSVRANSFDNRGTAGSLEVELQNRGPMAAIVSVFGILFTIGLFILGLILIRFAPGWYRKVEAELVSGWIVKLVAGFVALIAGVIVIILLAISLVGLPIAIGIGLLYLGGLLVSTLFSSLVLGGKVAGLLKREVSDYVAFTIGFVILNLLYRIPFLGTIILAIAVSLGFGALIFTGWKNRSCLCGSPDQPPG
jgi:cytoskeletal protein CcmA (bactofilin family)